MSTKSQPAKKSNKSTRHHFSNTPNSGKNYQFPSPRKNFKKNFIWNLVGGFINASISLFLMIAITRINGVNDAGIFSIGFAIACLVFYIGIYFGRVFQVTENPNISDKSFFIAKIIAVAAMLIITLLYLLTKNYDAFKFAVAFSLCFYKALEAFSEVIYGYFQKYEDLYISGISLTLKSTLGFFAFLIVDLLTHNFLLGILGLISIHLLVITFFDFVKMRKYHIFNSIASKSDIIKIFKIGFYPFALSFLSMLVGNSSKYAIDNLSTYDVQTYFNIIVMPATVLSLAAQFIVYPLVTTIRDYIAKNQYRKIATLTRKIILSIFGLGLVACLAAWLVGIPFLELLYGVDLADYRWLLVLIILAASFCACVYAYSNILICLRKLKSQTLLYFIVAIVSLLLAHLLVASFAIDGATYAYLISMILLFALYYLLWQYIVKTLKHPKTTKP